METWKQLARLCSIYFTIDVILHVWITWGLVYRSGSHLVMSLHSKSSADLFLAQSEAYKCLMQTGFIDCKDVYDGLCTTSLPPFRFTTSSCQPEVWRSHTGSLDNVEAPVIRSRNKQQSYTEPESVTTVRNSVWRVWAPFKFKHVQTEQRRSLQVGFEKCSFHRGCGTRSWAYILLVLFQNGMSHIDITSLLFQWHMLILSGMLQFTAGTLLPICCHKSLMFLSAWPGAISNCWRYTGSATARPESSKVRFICVFGAESLAGLVGGLL